MSHDNSAPPIERAPPPEAPEGQFPAGRFNADDKGAIQVAIAQENGKVVIALRKPAALIGFTGDEAMEIAAALVQYARAVA